MSDLSDVRDGIKTVLEANITGLRVYTYPPDEAVADLPALVLEDDDPTEYNELAIGGNGLIMDLTATLYLVGASSREQRAELDAYRSPTGSKSIKAAIRVDDTINSKADVAEVVSSQEVRRDQDDGGIWQYSCQFTIRVVKSIA